MTTLFDYAKTPINHEFKTTLHLEDGIVNNYLLALDLDEKSDAIPPSIFAVYHIWNSTIGKPAQGTIHLKQKMEYFSTPSRGDIFDVIIKIVEKHQKKNKNYLVFETLITKENKIYCRGMTKYLWGFTAAN